MAHATRRLLSYHSVNSPLNFTDPSGHVPAGVGPCIDGLYCGDDPTGGNAGDVLNPGFDQTGVQAWKRHKRIQEAHAQNAAANLPDFAYNQWTSSDWKSEEICTGDMCLGNPIMDPSLERFEEENLGGESWGETETVSVTSFGIEAGYLDPDCNSSNALRCQLGLQGAYFSYSLNWVTHDSTGETDLYLTYYDGSEPDDFATPTFGISGTRTTMFGPAVTSDWNDDQYTETFRTSTASAWMLTGDYVKALDEQGNESGMWGYSSGTGYGVAPAGASQITTYTIHLLDILPGRK